VTAISVFGLFKDFFEFTIDYLLQYPYIIIKNNKEAEPPIKKIYKNE
jgi:hypothetical protein